MEKLFSHRFISLRDAEQMSLMKVVQVVFHSYLTIWTRTQLAFERMLCIWRDIFSMAPYSITTLTMYDLRLSLWSLGRANHFC